MKRVDFLDWENSYYLSSGAVELIFPVSCGPRILKIAASGGNNIFFTRTKAALPSKWQGGGGHWFTYGTVAGAPFTTLDDSAIGVEASKGQTRLRERMNSASKVVREIDIKLSKHSPRIELIHRIHNLNAWEIALGIWSQSVFPLSGVAILPLFDSKVGKSIRASHATDFQDARIKLGEDHLSVQLDSPNGPALELSSTFIQGYMMYWNAGTLCIMAPLPHDSSSPPINAAVRTHADCVETCFQHCSPPIPSGSFHEFREDWFILPYADKPSLSGRLSSDLSSLISSNLRIT